MLTSMDSLVLLLRCQGKYKQTEETHRQAIRPRERLLGKEHPDTLTSVHYLAYLLDHQKGAEVDLPLFYTFLSYLPVNVLNVPKNLWPLGRS
jgi:hypothetical protein